jgi:hypothetical protein
MAYSMLGRLKHVKAHAKNLLKTAGRTERGIFFRERMRLILGDLLPFYRFSGLPRKAAFEKSGHSCSNFGHSISCMTAKYSISATAQSPGITLLARSEVRHLCSGFRGVKGAAAFTLVEAMISCGVLVLFTAACLSSIMVNQVSVRKAKEEAIAIDFLTKYTENIKALPFTSVAAGLPINNLYNGLNGAVLIAMPPTATPTVSLLSSANAPAYLFFYPDLLWFNNRNPTMTVTLTPSAIVGHDIEVNVKFDWDPPISKGGRQEVQVDFFRTKDTTQL